LLRGAENSVREIEKYPHYNSPLSIVLVKKLDDQRPPRVRRLLFYIPFSIFFHFKSSELVYHFEQDDNRP
jgi:hypothetical protein